MSAEADPAAPEPLSLQIGERTRLLSIFNGFAALTENGPEVVDTLLAEEELWKDFDRSELRERSRRLAAVIDRSQLSDQQRALSVLMLGRLQRHLRARE